MLHVDSSYLSPTAKPCLWPSSGLGVLEAVVWAALWRTCVRRDGPAQALKAGLGPSNRDLWSPGHQSELRGDVRPLVRHTAPVPQTNCLAKKGGPRRVTAGAPGSLGTWARGPLAHSKENFAIKLVQSLEFERTWWT